MPVGAEKYKSKRNTRQASEKLQGLPSMLTWLPPEFHPSNWMGIEENGPRGSVVALTSPGSKLLPTGYAALVDGSAVTINPAVPAAVIPTNNTSIRIVFSS